MTKVVTKKVQLCMSDGSFSTLTRLLKASGAVTMVEVIRQSLDLYDWAYEQVRAGYAIGAYKPGEPFREVMVFRNKIRD